MAYFPLFLSVVFVVRNEAPQLEKILEDAQACLAPLVSDYELIVVDNASEDDSVATLRSLTGEHGFANLQVYALTKQVESATAFWVGLENALGDFVAVIDPLVDDIGFLPQMLEKAVTGADVVFATNRQRGARSLAYRGAEMLFNVFYKALNGVHLSNEAPPYRVLSKSVINFILRHPQPALSYRHLPATAGFSRVNLAYDGKVSRYAKSRLSDGIDQGMRLLVSSNHTPMRAVTMLSLFGAVANLVYSLYVVAIGLFKTDVAPGWISMSLQQSGMFFLISLVLLVLGEYILNMASLSNEGPLYHVAQEFTSVRVTRREKLNIEEAAITPPIETNS